MLQRSSTVEAITRLDFAKIFRDTSGPDLVGHPVRPGRHGRTGHLGRTVRPVRRRGDPELVLRGRDAVSIVSDHALHSFTAGPDGTPRIGWRQTYDRGAGTKPGSVNQGSGTAPDLFGTDDEYVAITDNADDRMNVLVFRRGVDVPDDRCLVHEKEPNALGIDAWYLTAVDFRAGERRRRTLTGTGPAYDNNWVPITIGPDGTEYAGVFNGIFAVRDTA